MTKTPKQELAYRELARRYLHRFTKYTMWNEQDNETRYHTGAHQWEKNIQEMIDNTLQKVFDWKIQRLLVALPPRTGKSEKVCKRLPAFFLGRRPDKNVIVVSSNHSLASKFSRETLDIVQQTSFKNLFPDFQLSKNKKESGDWETSQGGGYYAVGVGGQLPGRGFDLGIIDDPIKSREEAESDTIREKINEWISGSFFTRAQTQNSAMIVMMHRWHERDLIGHLLELEAEGWPRREKLFVPAIDDDGNHIVRPGKRDQWYFDEQKKSLTVRDWNSLYQQQPYAEDWDVFKSEYFQFYQKNWLFDENWGLLEPMRVVGYCDPANRETHTSDSSAIVILWIHKKSNLIYVLDVRSGRVNEDVLYDIVFELHQRRKPERFGIEVNGFQKVLANEIKKQMRVRNYYFVLDEITNTTKKEGRIRAALLGRMSSGSILILKTHTDLQDQLIKFPNGKHDDIIDALAWAVAMLPTFNIEKQRHSSWPRRVRDPITKQWKTI